METTPLVSKTKDFISRLREKKPGITPKEIVVELDQYLQENVATWYTAMFVLRETGMSSFEIYDTSGNEGPKRVGIIEPQPIHR